MLGRQIALPRATELTSRGAAIIGFEQLGILPHNRPEAERAGPDGSATEPSIARVFHPDARSHAIYRAAAARQRSCGTLC